MAGRPPNDIKRINSWFRLEPAFIKAVEEYYLIKRYETINDNNKITTGDVLQMAALKDPDLKVIYLKHKELEKKPIQIDDV